MRERKYIKFRVDMYEDTKFKIIDRMEKRDLIHYIWTRLVTLAGKVNLEGDLYLSKNIPYTIETLSIEFNRDSMEVKLALNTLMDLEMIEFIENKIYRVKNFVKHQNIKVKEDIKIQENGEKAKNNEEKIDFIKEEKIEKSMKIHKSKEKDLNSEYLICEAIEEIPENKTITAEIARTESLKEEGLDNDCGNTINIYKHVKEDYTKNDPLFNTPIPIEKKNTKRVRKNKSKSSNIINQINETNEEEQLIQFFDGEDGMPQREGDRVIMTYSM